MKEPEVLALGKAKLNEGVLSWSFWDYAHLIYLGVIGCVIVYLLWEIVKHRKNAKNKRS